MQFRQLFPLALVLSLSACGQPSTGTGVEADSRALSPDDPSLAATYERSCRNCHTVAATGSPLTGDTAAWAPRMDKGMNILVDNVIMGIGGMPPYGLCMECDEEQFEALTRFMATGK